MVRNAKKIIIGVGVAIVLVAIILAAKSQQENKKLQEEVANLQQQAQQQGPNPEEVKQLVEEVGKLIVLPEGEDPTVATITDKERLQDVPFFSKAENEDKVLIYVNARKAFLYRPSTQKIIEVATLNLNTAAQNLTANVALRNGTDISGLTLTLEDSLKTAAPKLTITVRDNAKRTDFSQTIIIDLTGNRGQDAQNLAALLSARVGELPEGEDRPEGADFLILIGRDKVGSPAPTASPAASPTASPARTSPAASPQS
ncbi:MAG: hypothetical protein WEA04_04235 [Candidatus Andersenbacteria bacterium]